MEKEMDGKEMSRKVYEENFKRSGRAKTTIYHYKVCYQGSEEQLGSIWDEDIIDLLTDLRHLCWFKRLDFSNLVELSKVHFFAELNGEDLDDEDGEVE